VLGQRDVGEIDARHQLNAAHEATSIHRPVSVRLADVGACMDRTLQAMRLLRTMPTRLLSWGSFWVAAPDPTWDAFRVERLIEIAGDMIRLGQVLKLGGVASGGAEAKLLIASGQVTVNGEPELRRGRQLHPGDVVNVGTDDLRIVAG
jgi:ribosome-associated protein